MKAIASNTKVIKQDFMPTDMPSVMLIPAPSLEANAICLVGS